MWVKNLALTVSIIGYFGFCVFFLINGFTAASLLTLLNFLRLMNSVNKEPALNEAYYDKTAGIFVGVVPSIYLLGVIALTLISFQRL